MPDGPTGRSGPRPRDADGRREDSSKTAFGAVVGGGEKVLEGAKGLAAPGSVVEVAGKILGNL